ncbi:MAG: hypothetical protein L0312_19620 [Acidobacteria bacterium]|nr:hypothetical protein [Acidobacteriota bacterium]
MKRITNFMRGWRLLGESWAMYIFVPFVGLIVLLGLLIFMIGPYPILRLCGFSNEDIWD